MSDYLRGVKDGLCYPTRDNLRSFSYLYFLCFGLGCAILEILAHPKPDRTTTRQSGHPNSEAHQRDATAVSVRGNGACGGGSCGTGDGGSRTWSRKEAPTHRRAGRSGRSPYSLVSAGFLKWETRRSTTTAQAEYPRPVVRALRVDPFGLLLLGHGVDVSDLPLPNRSRYPVNPLTNEPFTATLKGGARES